MKKEIEQPEVEYIPFGDEWREYIKKMTKDEIITLYRNACIELQNQRELFLQNMFK